MVFESASFYFLAAFHQYWRLRAASSFEPTWMLKEVEFYHLTTSNKSLIDDPKRGYAKNYYQGKHSNLWYKVNLSHIIDTLFFTTDHFHNT